VSFDEILHSARAVIHRSLRK